MSDAAGTARPPVFLDRDGTLIIEKHYLADPRDVGIEAGVIEGLTLLRAHGHPLIVLTNQSGIGRGYFDEAAAQRVQQHIDALLRQHGIVLSAWYVCPHSPEALCRCRKPNPGLAIAASLDLEVALPGSYVIGDKRSDLELADAIGAHGLLVMTGHGRSSIDWAHARAKPVFENLLGAARHIVSRGEST